MPLPQFDNEGNLPPGVHDGSLEEVRERFGSFNESDQRCRLFARLSELISLMSRSGLFREIILDGSFVTSKSIPNDIDLIAVLRADHDLERELPMDQYALVCRPVLARRFGFDVILAKHGSQLYCDYVEFFSRVRAAPHLRKGMVRLQL